MTEPGASLSPLSTKLAAVQRPDSSRITIGVLSVSLADSRFMEVYAGATEVAEAADANLICYIAGKVDSPKVEKTGVRDAFAELISPTALDGLLTLQFWFTREWFLQFCQPYINMPIVTAFRNYEGFGGASVGTYQGDYALAEHLIADHGYTRIAYVCARLDVTVFQLRHQAYLDACAAHGITPSEALTIRFEDWTGPFHPPIDPQDRARRAVAILLDERGLVPGKDIDALICAWEPIAIQLVHEFQRRGFRVPQDIAIVGDENTREGAIINPALSSVGINWREVGRQSARIMLARIHDPQHIEHVQVPAEPVLRRSCGCHSADIQQAGLGHADASRPTTPEALLSTLQASPLFSAKPAQAAALFDAFLADIQNESETPLAKSRFLAELESLSAYTTPVPKDLASLHRLFIHLRHYSFAQFSSTQNTLFRAETLLQQGKTLVDQFFEHQKSIQHLEQDRLLSSLQTISQQLMSAFDIHTLLRLLEKQLPQLGITRSYISMYEDPSQPQGTARLLMAFDENGVHEIPAAGIPFASAMLAPPGTFPADKRWNLVVEPLYFGSDQIGFIVYETRTLEPRIYALLRGEINNAIKSTLLMQRVSKRSEELEKANTALHDSISSLKHYQEQLIRSEKMAALGQLVAGISHEINTPIGIGVTAASFLDQESRAITTAAYNKSLKKSELDHYLKTAQESSQLILNNLSRASELIRSFKRVAVDQSFEDERTFLVKPYLHDILASLTSPLRQGQHEVTVDCPDDLDIHCAAGAFYQILTNLIMNSILHGFEDLHHGQIHIHFSSTDNTTLQLLYTDNGKGMSKSTLRKVFDPFFTTKRNQGGTGLGMNIVYNLVTQKLQGSIDCHSAPGEGVAFTIHIPRVPQARN